MEEAIKLAIIGGSGLYNMDGLKAAKEYKLETPFGLPSAPIVVGELEGQRVAFLARHGIGHRLMPSNVPYRANIYALKSLGVERIVSISACGSLRKIMLQVTLSFPINFTITQKIAREHFLMKDWLFMLA